MVCISKIRTYREFNSPHNTSFFILGITTIGLFYLYSGYFTELSNFYLFRDLELIPPISVWILVFSVPYLIYGLYSIYLCLNKFQVVYIHKDRSLGARKFGLVYTIGIFISNIIFLVIIVSRTEVLLFEPVMIFPEFIFILYSILIFIEIVYGMVKIRKSASDFSQELIERRRAQVESIQSAPVRTQRQRPSRSSSSSSSRSTRRSRTSQTSRSSRSSTSSSKPKRRRSKAKPKPKPKPKPSPTRHKLSKTERERLFKKVQSMRPKTGQLTIDDFKCIFCFNLPQYPKDQGRGIILCPHCNYPAHADEFKDWVKSSKLCSRCGSEISSTFRRNPQIIPVKFYTRVIRYFRKKEKF